MIEIDIFVVKQLSIMHFIIADNQDITHIGISSLLSILYPDAHQHPVFNSKELREGLRLFPDAVVVVDYPLFDFSSHQHLLNLKAAARESRWILFSEELSASFIRQMLFEDPEIGIVMKTDNRAQIELALRCAATKRMFRCDFAVQALRERPEESLATDALTLAERSVLREIALGRTTKEIAMEKQLSFHTINAHRKNIFRKLAVNNANEATRYALRAGIIDVSDYSI